MGDGPIVLGHVALDIPGIDSRNFTLNAYLKPGEIATKTFPRVPHSGSYTLINHSTIHSWRHAVAKARHGFGPNCVAAVVLSENDAAFMMFTDVDKNDPHEFRFLNATMKVQYVDLHSGAEETFIPVRGVLYARRDCPEGQEVLGQMNRSRP